MKYFILPGFSEKNKEWAYEIKTELDTNGVENAVVEWEHWTSGVESDFDFAHEGEKIVKEIGDTQVGIIAKSVGSILATKLLKSIPGKISKLALMGIPLKSLTENDKSGFSFLKDFPAENIKIFQNSQDPYGSFKEVREFIGGINEEIEVVMLLRDDHHYPVNEVLLNFVKEE